MPFSASLSSLSLLRTSLDLGSFLDPAAVLFCPDRRPELRDPDLEAAFEGPATHVVYNMMVAITALPLHGLTTGTQSSCLIR